MRSSITVLVLTLLTACASNDAQNRTAGLALDFAPTPTAAGEEISLVLRNGSSSPLGYNLCTARLSQEARGNWVIADRRPDCPTEQQTLAPGAEATHEITLPEALAGGNYRFSLRTQVGDSRVEEIYSRTFTLPEPPAADSAAVDGAS